MANLKFRRSNVIFLIVIVLLLVPQTRKPIQILLHKGLALFSPSIVEEDKATVLTNYNWELKDLNNATINLNDLRGQVVFINLWATWCPPCIAEMPNIQNLYNDYNDKIVFLLISNENSDVVQKFMEKHEYHFKTYQPSSESPTVLKSRSIPRTFLIDKNGHIVIDKSGAANWNSEKVRDELDKLISAE